MMKAKTTMLWLLMTSVLVGALAWHFPTTNPSHSSSAQASSPSPTTAPAGPDREVASLASRSDTQSPLLNRLSGDASNEAALVSGNALDEARIDRLLADAGDFNAMINAMHARASTDRELAEATTLFSTHLKSALSEEGSARTVLDFSCGRQLCLAQLEDPGTAPLDIRPLMEHDGTAYFHAASLSNGMTTLDGKPSIRAVFAIHPAINQIVSIPD
ncbi:hypothetical protein [Stenotrophomonas sp. 24(2023)]|uniref:hypothetical protein n=1 Tax=Stenotrophomonas sp. 24(2023) TaxID=3068324 RepID=UPI0027DFF66A|nr:hypothetical protein [Stenotrophomonas sp. 24(2023)]WMJ68441.1 hypothetical protein Q9R17_14730 [Stenotrophomonas sp. 24(2023)]